MSRREPCSPAGTSQSPRPCPEGWVMLSTTSAMRERLESGRIESLPQSPCLIGAKEKSFAFFFLHGNINNLRMAAGEPARRIQDPHRANGASREIENLMNFNKQNQSPSTGETRPVSETGRV